MNKKEKFNIAMIGHKRVPSHEGGIEIVVEEISERLVKMGHCVTCYNRRGSHVSGKEFNTAKLKEYKGIQLENVITIDKKGLAAVTSSFFGCVKVMFSKHNVIHVHAEGPAVFCWIPKLSGKRVIVTIHGLDWQREKWKGKLAAKFIRIGEKAAVKFADEIIVLSKNVQNYFKEVYNRETVFISNGVNKPEKTEASIIKQRFNLDKDTYILYLGRLVPEKGCHYLINAFKNTNTSKKLVIAGGSSDTEDYIKELKNLSAGDDRIIFTGFVQGQIHSELYSNAYIYTLPSDLEGMPLSLLEAMSYGNCCLVSDINECTEVVEEKAVVFKKSDVEDLQKKLQYLCDNPDLVKEYKSYSSEFICSKYNWDDVVNKTLELYYR